MKCSECNKAIKKDDIFCGHCGKKIKKENKCFNILKENKKIVITIISVVIAIVVIFNIFNYIYSPSYQATKYFNYVVNNDVDKIYEYIDNDENDFVSKEILREKISSIKGASNIKVINKYVTDNDALITYSYKLNDKTNIANVSLTKGKSIFGLFNEWNINSGKINKNITIKVPKDSSIKIDNIKLDKYLKMTDKNLDIYEISSMINGEYKINIELKDGTKIEENFIPSDNVSIIIGDVKLSDDNINILNNLTNELLNNIYSNIINDNDENSINYNEDIKKIYRNLKYTYNVNNFKLNNFEISNTDLLSSSYNDNGNLLLTYEVEYNYDINYNENTYNSINRGIITLEVSFNENYNIENIDKLGISFPIRK